MAYMHRIDTEELPTQVIIPVESTAGLQVAIGLAPVNMVANPKVNVPVLCNDYAEAVSLMGFCSDFKNYTLCQVIDANFNVFQNAPIILINVLDPKKHKKTYTKDNIPVVSGVATIEEYGILLDGLTVKAGGTAMTKNVDYITGFTTTGAVEITLLDTEKTADVTTIGVEGNILDPTMITKEDIIGGYNVSTGEETGLEVLRQVYPSTGYVPGIVLAPHWSKEVEVAATMAAKVKEINGIFEALCVIDIDSEIYTTYTEAMTAKDDMGVVSRDAVLVWPKQKLGSRVYDGSVIWAAVTATTDANNSDIPKKSPSNELSNMTATILEDGTEILLDNTRAAAINSKGIVTFINDNGWRVWGNNTAAYPTTTDPKDRWISCRRMMNWYRSHFILTYKQFVDDPTSYRLTEAVVDAENVYLNSLTSGGHIAGGEVQFREEDNPITSILNGQVIFYTKIAFWTPAEHITNTIEFDPALIQSALQGGE